MAKHAWQQSMLQSCLSLQMAEIQLGVQVRKFMPRQLVSHANAGSWMTAADLVKLTMAAKQQAQQVYEEQGATVAACRQLHDAALGCTLFGYLPPVRLSCIRSLAHPSYTGPCLHPDCSKQQCRGNRLIVQQRQPLLLVIDLPHHKTQAANAFKPIHFTVPSGLAELLYLYIGQPHKVLVQAAAHVLLDAACPYVFMTRSGQGFCDSQFSTYWNTWLVANGGSPMPPSKLRHVFVGERRGSDRAAGPSDAAAARVMGHSEKQWSKWYDVHLHDRESQNAVDAMASWRQQMLQTPAKPTAAGPPAASQFAAMPLTASSSGDAPAAATDDDDDDDDDDFVIVLD